MYLKFLALIQKFHGGEITTVLPVKPKLNEKLKLQFSFEDHGQGTPDDAFFISMKTVDLDTIRFFNAIS